MPEKPETEPDAEPVELSAFIKAELLKPHTDYYSYDRTARALLEAQEERRGALMTESGIPFGDSYPIMNADFSTSRPLFDWRHYLPPSVRAIWQNLPTDARAALYLMASARAKADETGEDEPWLL